MKKVLIFSILLLMNVSEVFSENIKSETLNNGLQVVTIENHRSPLISLTCAIKVGNADSLNSKSGIATLLANLHLLNAEFTKNLFKLGSDNTVKVDFDTTFISLKFHPKHLNKVLELISERFKLFNSTETDLENEKKFAIQEYLINIDHDPEILLREHVNYHYFKKHPYRILNPESTSEFNLITLQDVRNFFKKHYSSNQIILVFVGDITHSETLNSAKKAFETITNKEKVVRTRAKEQECSNLKHEILLRSINGGGVLEYYYKLFCNVNLNKKSNENLKQIDAAILCSDILTSPVSGVYKTLVAEQELAENFLITFHPFQLDPLGYGIIFVLTDRPLQNLKNAFSCEINRIIQEGISQNQLTEAIKQESRNRQLLLSDIEDLSFAIAEYLANGFELESFFYFPERITKISSKEVLESVKILSKQPAVEALWRYKVER